MDKQEDGEKLDIIEYLHGFGAELQGLNACRATSARRYVLLYVRERLHEVLALVEQEVSDGDVGDTKAG